jgi:hypothetical protein
VIVVLLLLAGAQDLRPLQAADRLAFAVWRPGSDLPRDLRDLRRAGVDVALVDGPGAGLAEALEKAGDDRPLIAPYLDGAAPVDALRLFLERVPARFRAVVDGRLLVFLGPAPESGRGVPDAGLKAAAGTDALYVVSDATWTEAPPDRRWRSGLPEDGPVVAVPSRGAWDYEKAWFGALRLGGRWAVIEDWAAVREGGLLEATTRYVKKHRIAERITLPKGKWTGAPKALYTAKFEPHEQGLRPLTTDEGAAELVQLRGVAMLSSKEGRAGRRRVLSFDVDDSFAFYEKRSYTLTVEFLDAGEGSFRVEYDAADRALPPAERHLKTAQDVAFTRSGDWREQSIDLSDALFGNGQPGGADLRLVLDGRGIAVRRIALLPR